MITTYPDIGSQINTCRLWKAKVERVQSHVAEDTRQETSVGELGT